MRGVERPLIVRVRLVLSVCLIAITAASCGGGAQQPVLGDAMVESAEIATQSGQFQTPLDSTPDPGATTIYFTATGPKGPGVFRVPAAGGAATELAAGSPLVAPVGIAIGSDGRQLYIADPQAGQIFVLPVGGGAPSALRGTEGTAPRGMDIVDEGGQDMLYFTGRTPDDRQPAVFKRPAAGDGVPTIVVKGAPLVEPDGITATRAGVLFVADRSAAGGGFGGVFKVDGATVTKIVDRARLGDPAGIALTKDESVLLVSALQPDRESDQVLLVNLSTLQTGSITKGIAENHQAGGVHRARNSNIFSWADRSVRGSGGVYRIGTR